MNELFNILDESGVKTGETKARADVHRDGDWHASVHIWIARNGFDGLEFLLQKRSHDKDSFPDCFDAACTGHVDAGENYIDAALREIKEELGIEASSSELILLFSQKQTNKAIYNGENFISKEINKVYYFKKNISDKDIVFDKNEIESLKWISATELIEDLKKRNNIYCISESEFEKVLSFIEELK